MKTIKVLDKLNGKSHEFTEKAFLILSGITMTENGQLTNRYTTDGAVLPPVQKKNAEPVDPVKQIREATTIAQLTEALGASLDPEVIHAVEQKRLTLEAKQRVGMIKSAKTIDEIDQLLMEETNQHVIKKAHEHKKIINDKNTHAGNRNY